MEVRRVRVLFVCIGNACRSPMAEAIARQDAGDKIEASSAGLAPLGFISDLTKKTLVSNGYSVDDLQSKPISPDAWNRADIIINMSGHSRELTFREYSKVEDWEIQDPYGDPEIYPLAFEKIRQRVAELASRLEHRPPRDLHEGRGAQQPRDAKRGSRGDVL